MDEYRLRYVLYKEIDNIRDSHPLVYKSFLREDGEIDRFDSIKRNPDVYDDFPVLFYLENGEKVICSRFAMPDTLTAGDRQYQWAWGGGFYTDPAFRGQGLGTRLISFMTDILHGKNIGTGQAFSTPTSLHIYRKLGFTMPGYVNRYLFLKSCAPILKKYTRINALIKIADILFKPFSRAVIWLRTDRRTRSLNNYECNPVEVSDVESRIDCCKLCYSSVYRFIDSGAKLVFKLSHVDVEVFYIIAEIDNNCIPVAYFVLKNGMITTPLGGFSGFRLMSIMDYGFFDNRPVNRRLLAEYVFDIFSDSDAEVMDIVSSDDELNWILKKRGMLRIGKGMSFSFSVPDSWDLGEDFDQLQSWNLTHFSGDGFSID